VLPQTASGANLPVSGEYGSSSEGTVQLAGTSQYLAIMGYGVNAATFNSNPDAYSAAANTALAQSGSLTGQSYTPVPRVVTLVDSYGNVNSSTALYNIFNGNNPRSTYTADGLHIYVSGQGTSGDATGGVFYTTLGASSGTAITGADGGSGANQDTRVVQINNGTLYVSLDSKSGATNRSYIGTLGNPPSTTLYKSAGGPTQLTTANNASTPVAVTTTGKLTLTASETNGINSTGLQINLSPENYFFANAYTLYVADSGSPKQTSATSPLGDGGLQKWINTKSDGSGTWELQYTMYQGLNLVQNATANSSNTSGTTGLLGLTGVVSGSNVYLFATNYTIADLDQTYLYGIADPLTATTNPGVSFTQLAAAPANSNFKGVAFAPALPAGSTTITSTPSGLSFTSAGTGCVPGTYTTPVTLIWTSGSSCTLSVVSPQSAVGTQYVFNQWSDGITSTSDTVTAPSTSAVYNASFTTDYLLITAAGTGGTVSSGGYYAAGTQASITATPNQGYYFVNWVSSPDQVANSTAASTTITMNAEESVTANFATATAAAITSPTSGSTLTAASTTFTWTASGYTTPVYLWVGSTAGAYDLVGVGPLSGTSTTVTLPTTGAKVYVTLWSTVNGTLESTTATYTEYTALPSSLTSPTSGSTLTAASTTFTWAANQAASPYYLWVGSTAGAYDLAGVGPFTGTSATVTLPTNGNTVYATLWSTLNGTLVSTTATYKEATLTAATLTSPTSGSTLTAASTTFTWQSNGSTTPVYLWVGSTAGAYDLVGAGPFTGTSATVTLPTNGATVYATLWSTLNGALVSTTATYKEATLTAATLTSPTSGSTLTGASTTFTWQSNGSTTPVYLWLGSSAGAYDIAGIGPLSGTSTTVTLPTNGTTVYATLWSTLNGTLVSTTSSFTEATVSPATMTSPATGSTLGSTQTFTWAYNQATDPVYMWIGSTPGALDIAGIGPLPGGSTTVTLPTDGNPVYVTLWSTLNGNLVSQSYTYVDPTTVSPSNSSRNPSAAHSSPAVTIHKK
jgi:hypothetical protein